VEEGWVPVARFKSVNLALRAARWYADRFEYVVEWGLVYEGESFPEESL
jgi:hypothetical protein